MPYYCTWYVETDDSFTLQSIACEVPDYEFQRDLQCSDGVKRNLIPCPYWVVTSLENVKDYKYRLFCQWRNGPIYRIVSLHPFHVAQPLVLSSEADIKALDAVLGDVE